MIVLRDAHLHGMDIALERIGDTSEYRVWTRHELLVVSSGELVRFAREILDLAEPSEKWSERG